MKHLPRITRSFYRQDAVTVARELLGQRLVSVMDDVRCAGVIVETEAYLGAADAAAHSFGWRRTARNASMFGDGGTAYVFRTYGMHDLLNVVVGGVDEPTAVLIRALEPTEGLDAMRGRRPGVTKTLDLCNGPGKLARALGVDRGCDGADLTADGRVWIERVRGAAVGWEGVARGPRVGVDYAGDWASAALRFCLLGDPHISRAGARYNRALTAGDRDVVDVPEDLKPWLKRIR